MKSLVLTLAPLLLTLPAVAQVVPNPSLGVAEGRCRPNETGPAFLVTINGFKDRRGRLRLEVYPPIEGEFLADDAILINAGKTFRRVDIEPPPSGPVQMCVRVPTAGTYSISILHDRDSNHKFGLSSDGIAFPGNPRIAWSKPKAANARAFAGAGITPISVTLQYRVSLFSFGPLKQGR